MRFQESDVFEATAKRPRRPIEESHRRPLTADGSFNRAGQLAVDHERCANPREAWHRGSEVGFGDGCGAFDRRDPERARESEHALCGERPDLAAVSRHDGAAEADVDGAVSLGGAPYLLQRGDARRRPAYRPDIDNSHDAA